MARRSFYHKHQAPTETLGIRQAMHMRGEGWIVLRSWAEGTAVLVGLGIAGVFLIAAFGH